MSYSIQRSGQFLALNTHGDEMVQLHKIVVALVLSSPVVFVSAQDRRQVSEPLIPPTCTTVYAQKSVGADRKVAAADEAKLDSARIQAAIDQCKSGAAVLLAAAPGKNAFVSGPVQLREGVTLHVGKGVTFYASRKAADFDFPDAPGVCGSIHPRESQVGYVAPKPGGCRPLIAIAKARNAGVMGEGVIDGRGDMVLAGSDTSWWQRARAAEPENKRFYAPRLIVARQADGLVLYKIALHNSPNFHVTVNDTDGFTAWGVLVQSPTVPHTDARNTDGIDPGSSTNVTIAHSWIDTDDDNVAIKTGVTHMSVLHNHFYRGHGMSIGSETLTGVSHLLVDDLVMDATTSGIRIKSNVTRGGKVHDLVYQNICMRDVGVPIAISPYYMGQTIEKFVNPRLEGNLIPDYKTITLRNISILTPGDLLIAGHDDAHRTEVRLENVQATGVTPALVHVDFADITHASTNIPFTVPARAGAATPYNCDGKFVPMRTR
jgi:polygalacturonase